MERNKINPQEGNFTQIPNIIDDMSLSTQAFRLYFRIARRSCKDKACFETTTSLAKSLKMSKSSIKKAKDELQRRGLIIIETVKNENGGLPYHNITIDEVYIIKPKFSQGTK